jgi:benzoate membrane transport protein
MLKILLVLFGFLGLGAALADEGEREAALVTFLATASGMSLFGIGSAFWGLVLGVLVMKLMPTR